MRYILPNREKEEMPNRTQLRRSVMVRNGPKPKPEAITNSFGGETRIKARTSLSATFSSPVPPRRRIGTSTKVPHIYAVYKSRQMISKIISRSDSDCTISSLATCDIAQVPALERKLFPPQYTRLRYTKRVKLSIVLNIIKYLVNNTYGMCGFGDDISTNPKNNASSSTNSEANNRRLLKRHISQGFIESLNQHRTCEKLLNCPEEPAKYISHLYPTSAIDGITSKIEATSRITSIACMP
jgi:hypothetical protein